MQIYYASDMDPTDFAALEMVENHATFFRVCLALPPELQVRVPILSFVNPRAVPVTHTHARTLTTHRPVHALLAVNAQMLIATQAASSDMEPTTHLVRGAFV